MTKLAIVRKTLSRSFTAVLTAAAITAVPAMTALIADATSARAWDQQATEAQMDNELNHGAAGAYGHTVDPRWSGAHASANSRTHIRGFAAPRLDFQMEGR